MSYQSKVHETATYGDAIEYPFMALTEEAGEVMGKLAKFVRNYELPLNSVVNRIAIGTTAGFTLVKSNDIPEDGYVKLYNDVAKELGDVMWNVAECCTLLGITLEQLQERNLAKLLDRKERGVLNGEGDDR